MVAGIKCNQGRTRTMNHVTIPNVDDHIRFDFEDSGNYVYAISNREMNKIVHGLDLGGMAYFEFNDHYEEGVEFEKADKNSELFQSIQNRIRKMDERGSKTMTTTIIFKSNISPELKEGLRNYGFRIPEKMDNPIIGW